MKSYKKILCLTLALVMALSMSAFTMIAGAEGSVTGTVVFSEDFGDSVSDKPETGSSILEQWNGWTFRDYYTGSGTLTTITEDIVQKDGDNYVAEIKRIGHNSFSNIKSRFIRHSVSIPSDAEIARLSFKMRRTDANAKALTVLFTGADKNGNGSSTSGGFYFISDTYGTSNTINSSRIMSWGTNGDNGKSLVTNRKDKNPDAQTFYTVNQWYDFEITLNKATGTVSIDVDGNVMLADCKWSDVNIYGMPNYIDFGMHYYTFNDNSGANAKGSVSDYTKDAAYQIDDIAVTAYTAADVAAMAEQEVENALAKLSDVSVIKTAEDIKLPAASDLGTAATVTWASDNHSALADNGAITQAQTQQTAKLTATITSGTVSRTKEFDVIVLPQNVYFYEEFNSVATHSDDKLAGYNNWTEPAVNTSYVQDSVFTAQKDDSGNYYGSLLRQKSNSSSQFWELNKVVSGRETETNGGQSLSFRLKRDANSRNISVVLYGPKINTSDNSSAIEFKTNYHSVTVGGSSYYYPEAIMNEWLNVELVYKNGGVTVYVNGAPLTKSDGTTMPSITTTWTAVTKIGFYTSRTAAAIDGNSPTVFMLDDVCLKTLSEDYIACVSAKDSISFGNPIVNDLDITDTVYGTTITLNSSNPAVIADSGKVTRPDTDSLTPVTLTVTVQKGSDLVTQTYNVNVAPMYLTKITKTYVDENSKLGAVYITNYAKLEKAVAYVAVYTRNEAGAPVIKGVQIADDITYIKEKGSQIIGFSENKLTVDEGDEIKVFMWSDIKSLAPIAKSFSYVYSAEDTAE